MVDDPKALAEIAELLLGSELFGVVRIDERRRVMGQHGGVAPCLPRGGPVEDSLSALVGYEEIIAEVARGERRFHHLPDLRVMDDPDRYFSIFMLPSLGPPGATLLFQDTTEVSRLRQEIMQAKNDLQLALREAEQTKSRFYGMLSHEIRTPLNGVIGTLQNMVDADLDPRNAEPVGVALRSAHHLLGLLNDILDFSKLEASRLEFETATLELPELVADVAQLMGTDPRAVEQGLEVRSRIDAAVPRFVTGDPGRLRQILLNLVGNAVKFTRRGGVTLSVAPAKGANRIRFEVVDTGIGIPKNAQADLFDEYAQFAPSTTRRFGGTGLGLTICRRLVEGMGGSIGVESAPRTGSTFWFEVPLPRCDSPSIEGVTGRILVVDDCATSRLAVATMLSAAGHEVDAVGDGGEAVEAVRSAPYDLVLMDFRMPVLDGPSAAAEIRKLEGVKARVPILAMSASTAPELGLECDPEAFDARIEKPVAKKRLLATVAQWLSRRG